jgi:hypothetical protein
MSREKERTLERWRCIHAFILYSLLISAEFLICTAGFMGMAYMYGLVLPLSENQPHFLFWSRIRRTGHGFWLQLKGSACIAITIPVRLQQVKRTLID